MSNGGEYSGDLTKQITHLVAFKTQGQKYKFATAWNVSVVSIEWLNDSLERGMVLDESCYHPSIAAANRGKGAITKRQSSSSPLGKRQRDSTAAEPENGKRKLRRTASTRLSGANQNIWGDIMAGSRSNTPGRGDNGTPDPVAQQSTENSRMPTPVVPAIQRAVLPAEISTGMFHECCFYLHGWDAKKHAILLQSITSHGGRVTNTMQDFDEPGRQLRYFTVIPYQLIPTASLLAEVPETYQICTEFWIERCMFLKQVEDPQCHTLSRPLPQATIPGFERLTICTTGFTGIELLHMSKTVKLMGAKYDENFSKNASVLVCNTTQRVRQEKLAHANDWKVPVVSAKWLWDSITEGESKAFVRPYRIRAKKDDHSHSATSSNANTEVPEKDPKPVPARKTALAAGDLNTEAKSTKVVPKPPAVSGMDDDAFADDEHPVDDVENDTAKAVEVEPLVDDVENDTAKAVDVEPPVDEIENDTAEPADDAFAGNNPPVIEDEKEAPNAVTDDDSCTLRGDDASNKTLPDAQIVSPIEEYHPGLDSNETATEAAPPAVLKEISPNNPFKGPADPTEEISSSKLSAPPSAPSTLPPEVTTAISSLQAKLNPAAASTEPPSRRKAPRPRQNRILGRAPSNASIESAGSVDSTASHGRAVIWPEKHKSSGGAVKNFVGSFAPVGGSQGGRPQSPVKGQAGPATSNGSQGGGVSAGVSGEFGASQASQKVDYHNAASEDYKQQALAKLMGKEKPQRKMKERAPTVADSASNRRTTRKGKAGFR